MVGFAPALPYMQESTCTFTSRPSPNSALIQGRFHSCEASGFSIDHATGRSFAKHCRTRNTSILTTASATRAARRLCVPAAGLFPVRVLQGLFSITYVVHGGGPSRGGRVVILRDQRQIPLSVFLVYVLLFILPKVRKTKTRLLDQSTKHTTLLRRPRCHAQRPEANANSTLWFSCFFPFLAFQSETQIFQ